MIFLYVMEICLFGNLSPTMSSDQFFKESISGTLTVRNGYYSWMGSVCNAHKLVKWLGIDNGELGCEHCSVFRIIQAANLFDKMR